jgi:hypothetical protein
MLAVKRIPVAVVIDADSPEQEVASERRRSAEEVLGDAASGVPFRVIVAVPELEVLFFERPQLLKKVYGKSVTALVTELGQVSPRRALKKLDPDLSYGGGSPAWRKRPGLGLIRWTTWRDAACQRQEPPGWPVPGPVRIAAATAPGSRRNRQTPAPKSAGNHLSAS